MDIVQQLLDALGPDCVKTAEQASQRMASNWVNAQNLQCRALLLPQTTQEVSTALKICHTAKQAIVPHGGLTNVVGGVQTQPHEIALSLERMNVVEAIDVANQTATVQARCAAARPGGLARDAAGRADRPFSDRCSRTPQCRLHRRGGQP